MMKRLSVFVALACLGLALPMHAQDEAWSLPDAPVPGSSSSAVSTGALSFYFYNVGTGQFIATNGDYDAVLSVDDPLSLSWNVLSHIFYNGSYFLCLKENSDGFYFFSTTTASYKITYTLTSVELDDYDYAYTISGSFSGTTYYVTVDDGAIVPKTSVETDGDNAHWVLVSESDYSTYSTAVETWTEANDVRPDLADALTKAGELGLTKESAYTAAVSAYNDNTKSAEDITEALETLNELITFTEGMIADNEYTDGDVATLTDGSHYTIIGENLVQNGGFEVEVTNTEENGYVYGWACGGGEEDKTIYTATTSAYFSDKIVTTGGALHDGKYFSNHNENEIPYESTNARTLQQAIEVESGSNYLFICYTKGTAPTATEDVCGLYPLTYESDAYSQGEEAITTFTWDEASDEYNGWTKTEVTFQATTDYVGIMLSNNVAYFDAFQIYEVEAIDRQFLENALADAKELSDDFSEEQSETYQNAIEVYKQDDATQDEIDDVTEELALVIHSLDTDAIGDIIEEDQSPDGLKYKVLTANLIPNADFRYGYSCWTWESSGDGSVLERILRGYMSVDSDGDDGYYLTTPGDKYLSTVVGAENALVTDWGPLDINMSYYISFQAKGGGKMTQVQYPSSRFVLDNKATGHSDGAYHQETIIKDICEFGDWTEMSAVFTPGAIYLSSYTDHESYYSTEEDVYAQLILQNLNYTPISIKDFKLYQVALIDDEYEEGDEYTYTDEEGKETKYTVTGPNLVENGSFNEGLAGWKQGGYETDATETYHTLGVIGGGFSGEGDFGGNGQYVTITEDHALNKEGSLAQAVGPLTQGHKYVFLGHTKGVTPAESNIDESGLMQMSDATTESGTVLTKMTWGADYGETSDGWTSTEYVFTAESDYVGIRFAYCKGAILDGFQLYELAGWTKQDVIDAMAPAVPETPTANIGDGAFQYSQSAFEALASTIEELEDFYYTDETFGAACEELQAAVNAALELNGPEEGVRYTIKSGSDFTYHDSNLATITKNASNPGGYKVWFHGAEKAYLSQSVEFTAAEGLNCYYISFTDETGAAQYLCLGSEVYDNDTQEGYIRVTTDEDKAFAFEVVADTQEDGVWYMLDTTSDPEEYLGTYTSNGYLEFAGESAKNFAYDLSITEADKATVTVDFTDGYVFGTAVLPFAVTEEELEDAGVQAYKCFEVVDEGKSTAYLLTLTEYDSMEPNTPYLLYSECGEAVEFAGYGTFTGDRSSTDASETIITPADGNLFVGVMTEGGITAPQFTYVLQNQEDVDGLAFYMVMQTQPKVPQFRCYLDINATSETRAVILLPGTDVETAISSVSDSEDADSEAIYDLSGRRISKPQHGIYIKGGKKVFIK